MKPDQLHNRNRESEQPSTPGIKTRLQQYIKSIKVDVLGYEKKVIKNVISYLQQHSSAYNLPLVGMFARIHSSGVDLRVYLHHKSRLLKEVPVKELLTFMGGDGISEIPGMESTLAIKVSAYLRDFARENQVELHELNVLISSDGKEVSIEAYDGKQHTKYIPIGELIKHFR